MIRVAEANGALLRGGVPQPLVRPRLIERLRRAATCPVALIIAPAGYGKSSALQHYVETLSDRVMRYNVSRESRSFLAFVRGLCAALAEVAPALSTTLPSAYAEFRAAKRAASELAPWLCSHLGAFEGVVVIDDFHFVEEHAAAGAFLNAVIEAAGSRIRWIVASRSAAGLPIATWLAYGRALPPLEEAELRLTASESVEIAESTELAIRDDERNELFELTRGWPAGFVLALQTATGRAESHSLQKRARSLIYRYLAEQVFAKLAPAVQDFLLASSLLDRLNVQVLVAAGFDDAEAQLHELRERGTFIEQSGVPEYRCHELFRSFLQRQLQLRGQKAVRATSLRLAKAAEQCSQHAEMLRLLFQAGANDRLLDALERHGVNLIDRGHADVVARALGALDVTVRSSNPQMVVVRAALDEMAGRWDRAEALYRRALRGAQSTQTRITAALRLSVLLVNRSRAEPALLTGFLDLPDIGAREIAEIRSVLASSFALVGNLEEAAYNAQRAVHQLEDVGDDESLYARVLVRSAHVAYYTGDHSTAFEYALEGSRSAANCGNYAVAAKAFSVLYATAGAYEDDVPRGLLYLQQQASCAIQGGDLQQHAYSLLAMLDLEARRGNAERMHAIKGELKKMKAPEYSPWAFNLFGAEALEAAWNGDYTRASRLLQEEAIEAQSGSERALRYAEGALYLAAAGKRLESIAALAEVRDNADDGAQGINRWSNETAALLAVIANILLGRKTVAERGLRAATTNSGWDTDVLRASVRAFRDAIEWPQAWPEFDKLVSQLDEVHLGGYGKLLRAVARPLRAPTESSPLTNAEIEVLQALSSGWNAKELAWHTGRSVHTVQSHVRSAISKLGCRGRQQAIAIARRRGLIA